MSDVHEAASAAYDEAMAQNMTPSDQSYFKTYQLPIKVRDGYEDTYTGHIWVLTYPFAYRGTIEDVYQWGPVEMRYNHEALTAAEAWEVISSNPYLYESIECQINEFLLSPAG